MHRLLARVIIGLCAGFATAASAEGQSIRPLVAIEPFANLSVRADDDWLTRGLAETIRAHVEQSGLRTVITVANRSAERTVEMRQRHGRNLGADWFVAGTFQRRGPDVRVTAQLIDVRTATTVESVVVDGAIDDIFALQDGVIAELFSGDVLAGSAEPSTASRDDVPATEPAVVDAAMPPSESIIAPSTTSQRSLSPEQRSAVSVGPDRERTDDALVGVADDSVGILQGRPRVRPMRTDVPPTIDGRLDDEVWRTATMLSTFVQQAPLDGAPATEETEIYLAYDRDNLYFGFYLHYANPAIMRANRVDRDTAYLDDLMTVYFDPFMDQQRAYDFDVNGYNVQGDGIINAGRQGGGRNPIPSADRSWDTLFYSGAQIVHDGYTAEMAIPFKSLRYPQQPPGVEHRWGFQVVREIKAKNAENVVWAPMSRDIQTFMSQMGVLEGMTDLSTSRNLEILPTVTTVRAGTLDATGDFVTETTPEAGVNVKYGVTSNVTADFTINPDFSQIESDRPQIDVNQRFPLFYPELRPFFLEGAEIFQFTSPINFVHTRTIVDPTFGGKLTGKVGRTTLGVLVADDAAAGKRDDPSDPAFGQNAKVTIGRARYDLYTESQIGATFTDREFLGSYSRVGVIDAQFRLSRASRFYFVAAQSQHRDEEGQERSGPVLGLLLTRTGRNLSANTFFGRTDPDFRTDVGFVRRVNEQRSSSRITYRWWPQHWLINWGPSGSYQLNFNYDGIRVDEVVEGGVNFAFANNISADAGVSQALERFGGVNFDKTTYTASASTSTSRLFTLRGKVATGDEIYFDPENPYLGRAVQLGLSTIVRPSPRLTSQVDLDTSRFTDIRAGSQEVFNVKILRAFSTFTFTNRMLVRNITQYNSFTRKVGVNVLLNYRINALTIFYAGYDDHYRQEDLIPGLLDDEFHPSKSFRRTNRAVFMKLQYLFRY
jgi:TolB-like protein